MTAELTIPPKHRVDWFRVLADLAERGVSAAELAHELELSENAVRNWKRGSHPRHADGERTLELWCILLGRIRADVPLIAEHDYRA